MYSVTGFPGTVDRTCHPLPFRTLLCILIILVLALAAPVSAAVYTINPGDSIQTAINSAGSGDTIILNPGMYNEHSIEITRHITIQANTTAGGKATNTIIDAKSAGRIFNNSAVAHTLIIDNLTLQNGYATQGGAVNSGSGSILNVTSSTIFNCSATDYGGAIYADHLLNVTSSRISNSSSTTGGAIYATGSNVIIISSTISNSSSTNSGGAIDATGSIVTITTSKFSNCSEPVYGGAIYTFNSALTITSSTFSNCSAHFGGAIAATDSPTTITSSTFSNCRANNGGAIYTPNCALTITSSTFSNCSTTWSGGAIAAADSPTTITSSTFFNCSATDGGAIHATGSNTVNITSSTFSNCSAPYGGVIYCLSGTVTMHFSRINGNGGTAVYNNGGTVNAANNWWSTNADPSGYTYGGVTVSPWLVLNVTATPSTITHAQTSAIRMNLTYNSAGTDTTSGGIFVPDGIPVAFTLTSGTGSVLPLAGNITSGANTTTFTPAFSGTSTVSAMVDGETVATPVEVLSPLHILNPGDSIQQNITDAAEWDTLILNPGTYSENGIKVTKNITIRASHKSGHSAADTIIDGKSASSGIFTVNTGVTFAVENLTLQNGHTSKYGGAIYSPDSGTVYVTSSTFFNCSADYGGAIYAESKTTLTIRSSTFSNCSAFNGGAIFATYSTYTITSSTISNCSSEFGGAISSEYSTATIGFSRIYHNIATAVYNDGGTVEAADNWWGTNADPSGYTSGKVIISPWLVLNITATPSSINTTQTSKIRTNLTNNSAGTDTTRDGIFVPAGIPVAFAITSGTGSVLPQNGNITFGTNTTTFTPAGAGTSIVSATVDGETVSADIIVAGSSGTATMVGVFRPSTHLFILKNGSVKTTVNWGLSTDIPVSGDWNADGLADVGVFRPSTHLFILKNGSVKTTVNWGLSTDIPVSGDWNADGLADVGVYRPSTHLFILKNGSVKTTVNWGLGTDIPVAGDWNADGMTDVGVFRPSTHLFILKNGSVKTTVNWGLSTDIPVSGDWNGDGLGDVGVYRPSIAKFILKNGTERTVVPWGLGTDIPVTGKWS